ncbi:hypothetical protein MNBD_NITROSPINAE03-240 [hydrothermal vent metagenome]|uniref:mRNA interferase YafQ n=2 Tax=hydrothermal vent metagenome TaxID=652676 RepID=A0A3B1BZM3_9ZZZZ
MRQITRSSRFKSDLRKIARSGKFNADELFTIMELLCQDAPLNKKYRNHQLTGEWNGCRELHLKSDCLLIYRLTSGCLELVRIGSHAELFE